jgi:hypothetical protein
VVHSKGLKTRFITIVAVIFAVAIAGVFCRFSRLRGRAGFRGAVRLFARLTPRRRHVARTYGDTTPFSRDRLPGLGTDLTIGCIFWNIVHFDFSFGGDYRDDHINRSGSRRLQAKSDGDGR